MSLQARLLLCFAGLSLLCATVGGAAASHALTALAPHALEAFQTAVEFQFFHGLGVIAVTLVAELCYPRRIALWLAAWLLVAGTILFSGSIYVTTFVAVDALRELAPVGGIAFMAGWLLFAIAVCFPRAAITP